MEIHMVLMVRTAEWALTELPLCSVLVETSKFQGKIIIKTIHNKIKVFSNLIEGKKVFEEYFKMMGGMRSMLELGFASVAFYNFGSKSWQLIKKIIMFLFKTSTRFLSFIGQYIPI